MSDKIGDTLLSEYNKGNFPIVVELFERHNHKRQWYLNEIQVYAISLRKTGSPEKFPRWAPLRPTIIGKPNHRLFYRTWLNLKKRRNQRRDLFQRMRRI